MGLMSKLKNILFEEEEVEIPVIEKKEKKTEAKTDEVRVEKVEPPKDNYKSFYDDLEPVVKEEKKLEEKNSYQEQVSEREIFKSEKTFNFPAFDEEEFERTLPKQRSTNVLEYERKNNKPDYKKYEPKMETKKEEKPKFKPSPIISPVYGILDKNYTPDEITSRTTTIERKLDVDSVRKKAFGEKEDIKIEENLTLEDAKVMEENLNKARTIDELLKDSSDDIIDVEEPSVNEESMPNIDDLLEDNSKEEETKKEIIDTLESIETPKKIDEKEDTLESDLFDLIDSMYESREDGE